MFSIINHRLPDHAAFMRLREAMCLIRSIHTLFQAFASRSRMNAAVAAIVLVGICSFQSAHAGAQKEEELGESVRTALAAAIADNAPRKWRYEKIEDRIRYLNWLGEMSDRLATRRKDVDARTRRELLETIYYEAKRAGLDPAMVLGLIQVESNFRKYAISSADARGLMQVMPFWTRVIGDGDVRKLFHMQTNLRYGCTILRHYIDREKGNLFLALGRYNGSRGRDPYPNAVHDAWKRWETAAAPAAVSNAAAAQAAAVAPKEAP
jgi:soluble lytic murein transglycosylase-like protein